MSPAVTRWISNALWTPGSLAPVSHEAHVVCDATGSSISAAAFWDRPSFFLHFVSARDGLLIPSTMVLVATLCKRELVPWL